MGLNGSKYFIISILIIKNDSKKLKYIVKRSRKFKFKKELKKIKELKFYNLSKKLRLYFLNELKRVEFEAHSIVLEKNKLEYLLQRKNKNEIYMDMVIKLLEKINIKESLELTMDNFFPIDKTKDVESFILNKTNIKNSKIKQNSSEKIIEIQFSDLIAGACFQSFERKNKEYIKRLGKKHKIHYY